MILLSFNLGAWQYPSLFIIQKKHSPKFLLLCSRKESHYGTWWWVNDAIEFSTIPYINRERCIVIYDKDLSDKLVRRNVGVCRSVELCHTSHPHLPVFSLHAVACRLEKKNLVLLLKEKDMEKLVCWNIGEEEGWGWSKYEHESSS